MAGMVTNPMAQLQSQGIQNAATQAQIANQGFMDKVMKGYLGIANNPAAQTGAINYLQGSPSGVGGFGGSVMNAVNPGVAGTAAGPITNPTVTNSIMGNFQSPLNKMASGAFYTSLGLPFGAHVPTPGSAGTQQINGNGIMQSLGSALGTAYANGAFQSGGNSSLPGGAVFGGGNLNSSNAALYDPASSGGYVFGGGNMSGNGSGGWNG